MQTIEAITKRRFLPDDLRLEKWSDIESYVENLLSRDPQSEEDFRTLLEDLSECEAVLEEDMAWRYIKMNIDTTDAKLREHFEQFVTDISPTLSIKSNEIEKRLVGMDFINQLSPEHGIYVRNMKNSLDLFREENVAIETEVQKLTQDYGAITGAMTVEMEGKEITLPQASVYMKNTSREIREEIYRKTTDRRSLDSEKLDGLFTSLLNKRHAIASHAGFQNFRDYKFRQMGRFDYDVNDCQNFHQSIRESIVPLVKGFNQSRLTHLKLEVLKPWDMDVDPKGRTPLKPFERADELIAKTIECFNCVDPFFGHCISEMQKMGHLDLESKKGKAPGGFNYPLYESGVPFIYMNAVGSARDVVTMVHEGGHAVHSFLSRGLKLTGLKNLCSEIAELASMGMELISMSHWNVFYPNEEDLIRAKQEQLEKIISILPWIAMVDQFQHWLYVNPEHSISERHEQWINICNMYSTNMVDYSGFENNRKISWQSQLHIYEVPFYYIEYGFAQLGAIALWKNYMENQEKTIAQYKDALSLGYTKSIPEIYETAGIQFNFSPEYVKELMTFVNDQLNLLN